MCGNGIQATDEACDCGTDHASNLAERAIFIVTGEDVRHFSRMSRSDFP